MDSIMIGDGVTEEHKEKSNVFDNMAIIGSNAYSASAPCTPSKNENPGSGLGKFLQDNFCGCSSITTTDSMLKNMHRKWSLID
jgi:hypothetical protein